MDLSKFGVDVKLIIKNDQSDPHAAAMGRGIVNLCRLVDETGSLNKAAHEMGMAYSKAWSIIKHTEEAFGFQLLERKGNKGSELTEEARRIVNIYEELQQRMNREANKLLKQLLAK
ncbi:winged helix-turn-helix domain-containing protein [Anaerotardibacter muris]|uniref:winged helix-turn-helix domain-containing protein n=1 Tax=Anaerotardibacter muris TaxID=2941505 RepID=UPI002041675F|nr:LysR family transcriptional regulator [Anaerotardibacter muris]